MIYKTSLLIYRAQTINVSDLWNSKVRLIKSLTPLFRKLKDKDFDNIDSFKSRYSLLIDSYILQIAPISTMLQNESNPTIKDQLAQQISEIKLQYIIRKSDLCKELKN